MVRVIGNYKKKVKYSENQKCIAHEYDEIAICIYTIFFHGTRVKQNEVEEMLTKKKCIFDWVVDKECINMLKICSLCYKNF